MTDTLSARLLDAMKLAPTYIEVLLKEAADEIDRLTKEVAMLETELTTLRTDYLCLTTDVEVCQAYQTKADALAEAMRELQKQGHHENGPEPDGNGAYVVSDIDWQEFEAALTAYKEGDS